MTASAFLDKFPALPDYQAHWLPVYIEPMMGSGERITIAVAVQGLDGKNKVARGLSDRAVRAFYGSAAERFTSLMDVTIQSLKEHMESQSPIDSWEPPFEGVEAGKPRRASGDNIGDVVKMALKMSAGMSSMVAAFEVNEETKNESIKKKVRDYVVRKDPSREKCFNRKFSTRKGARDTRIFYQGSYLAANVCVLRPGPAIGRYFNAAKLSLMDLESFRVSQQIALRPHHELVVVMDSPLKQTNKQKAAEKEVSVWLEHMCDRHEIRLEIRSDYIRAAERIIERDVA